MLFKVEIHRYNLADSADIITALKVNGLAKNVTQDSRAITGDFTLQNKPLDAIERLKTIQRTFKCQGRFEV